MSKSTTCPYCVHGFVEDYSHPTERRLKSCDECGGSGRMKAEFAEENEHDTTKKLEEKK